MRRCQLWRVITQSHILFDYGNNFNHGDGTSAGDRLVCRKSEREPRLTAGRKDLDLQFIDYYNLGIFVTCHQLRVAPYSRAVLFRDAADRRG